MKVFESLSKVQVATLVTRIFVYCFAATYAIYCYQADGKIFLPTLSQTFDFKPGNFLSRWSIGVGCVGLYMVEILTYFGYNLKKQLLLMIKFAVLCLSIVGAVCSDEKSIECKGNPTIHYTSATLFFILYDIYIVIFTIEISKHVHHRKLYNYCRIAVCLVLLTKIRFLIPFIEKWVERHMNFPYLALFEWMNVAVIIAFTYVKLISIRERYSFCFIENKNDMNQFQNGDEILWKMTGAETLNIALRYALGTLISCLVISYLLGNIDETSIPMISDTFVSPPGNYISRWAGVIGTTFLQLANLVFYHIYKDKLFNIAARFALVISVVATFALSLVVVISEREDLALHLGVASVFFNGYNILICFMIFARIFAERPDSDLDESLLMSENKKGRSSWISVIAVVVLLLLLVLSKIRYIWRLTRDTIAILEWTDANCILAFLILLPSLFPNEIYKFQYVIVLKPDKSETLDP